MAAGAPPGGARRAVMRVEAKAGEGEFGQVRTADDDRAGGPESGHENRVARCRRRLRQHSRAGPRDRAADIEQILHRERHALEWAGGKTRRPPRVRSPSLDQSAGAEHLDEGGGAFSRGVIDPPVASA